jgi:hypothetical protein
MYQLLELWRECLVDHHKDKDCHFYIQQHYESYGIVKVKYRVEHWGYLHDWDYVVSNLPEAECLLIQRVYMQIVDECNAWINSDDPDVLKTHPIEKWEYMKKEALGIYLTTFIMRGCEKPKV